MIEGLFADLTLVQWNTLLGLAAAVVTIIVGLIRLRKRLVLWFYLYPKKAYLKARARKERQHAQRIFTEIQDMLEQEITRMLEGYSSDMHEQGITIASAIAENVEFKNYITRSMSILHDTMTKIADAVEINACDAKTMRERLNEKVCDRVGACDERLILKRCEGENSKG